MRAIAFITFLLIFLCGMWTSSSSAFINELHISFQLTTEVSWNKFWDIRYLANTEPYFVISKIGHLVGSFLLGILYFNWLGLKIRTLIPLFILIAAIEISQEYFTRDARFLDLAINTAGVLLAVGFYKVINKIL
ncbi:VanZ family protein [Bacillus piscicola]|uniref:VanZ family protein n=1 Tax=Bacillus piscicola TaxID=1632684 RepID=UPI001F089E7D|nr:VanZ family protein [Bacillus piscicola]